MAKRPRSTESYQKQLYAIRAKSYLCNFRNAETGKRKPASQLTPAEKAAVTKAFRKLATVTATSRVWTPPRKKGESEQAHEKRIKRLAREAGRPNLRGIVVDGWTPDTKVRLLKDGSLQVKMASGWTERHFGAGDIAQQAARAFKAGAESVAIKVAGSNRTQSVSRKDFKRKLARLVAHYGIGAMQLGIVATMPERQKKGKKGRQAMAPEQRRELSALGINVRAEEKPRKRKNRK